MLYQSELIKGRGAQINPSNRFHSSEYVSEYLEGIDEKWEISACKTKYYVSLNKSLVNKVNSPDISYNLSINPYQGCEHGCIYCYARESHQYWGFSSGLDFESRIIVKPNAPELLKKYFNRKSYNPQPIMLSGNTDCYQPIERKLRISRKLLEVFWSYRNPVSIITKNYTILRDLDLLKKLADKNLVKVTVSITSLDMELQQKLEPRTASPFKRLKVVKELSENNIPVSVMIAPIIPGLNDNEIPDIMETIGALGAYDANFIIVRLNGSISDLFSNWLDHHFPSKKKKIMNAIAECHGGQVNDSRFGTRMKGEGNLAKAIGDLFRVSKSRFINKKENITLSTEHFRLPSRDIQPSLF